ncbi:MAG: C4-dicarboxylate ABC transporter permease, partial [Tardiphaga sp.]
PFVFVCDPQGVGLLLNIPKGGTWVDIVEITFKTTCGLLALAAVAQNWALRLNTPVERGLLLLAGLLLVFPSLIEAVIESMIGRDISYTFVPGLIIGLGVLLWQMRTRAPARPVLTT